MSDMTALLNDLSYIPPNNEHNEPTQGDIGETSNKPTQDTRNEFEELYASANEELYPGCDYVTRLDFMTNFTYFKVKGKLTDSIFNEMLEFFQNVFPISKGYKLPPSYYAIKKTFKMIGLGWKDNNTQGKKVPKKVLRNFSIIPRLQRLYKSSYTAKEMIWHATRKCTEPDKIQHLVDGVETIDVASGQKFNMRAMVLWTINDFPARSSLSGWSGKGYKACPTWNKDTPYVRVLSKTTYVSHRRFLKKPHKWRSSLEFNGETDNRDPPKEFGRDEILAQLDRLPMRVKGKHPSYEGVKIKRNVHVELNWTKRSIFYELEYWSFLSLRHNLDIMHIAKNVLGAILNTLLMNDKSKDTVKARQELERLGIQNGLWLGQKKNEKGLKPQAAYSFTPENRKKFSKPEGSIAEGYVAEEALTFSSHYFQDVTTKFNRPDLNVDPPPPTCQFQVFRSVCKSIGLRSVIRFDAQELKKVKWYVLHNNPEIDTYRSQFKSHDECRTTQNSGICSPGPDGEMYYGQLQEILEFKYLLFKVVLFRLKWFDTQNQGRKVKRLVLRNNMTQIDTGEDDPDIILFDNSSDLLLSTSLNDIDNATLHIDGQSTEVDAPPDIIDVVDEDDDIIDDEDALPHDLAYSDDEDLINVDDDGVDKMSANVARSHGGDGGGKGKRKPNLGDRAAGKLNTHDKTRNLSLKKITDTKCPVLIRFELRDKQTLMPLGEHVAHWSSYIGEVIRGVPLYHPSWLKVPKERKAALIAGIETQFDLRPHMKSPDWTEIHAGIQQHLKKAYNTNKAAFKAQHWVIDPTTETYNVEKIRRARPQDITTDEWDKYIQFWNDPRNIARAAQNRQN
nr:hypothetical protein [Tanacetum cinerariifolium]